MLPGAWRGGAQQQTHQRGSMTGVISRWCPWGTGTAEARRPDLTKAAYTANSPWLPLPLLPGRNLPGRYQKSFSTGWKEKLQPPGCQGEQEMRGWGVVSEAIQYFPTTWLPKAWLWVPTTHRRLADSFLEMLTCWRQIHLGVYQKKTKIVTVTHCFITHL